MLFLFFVVASHFLSWWMLAFVISEQSEESSAMWMLRFAQQ
jgi:hypothetical protein